ncbi:MAG: aminoglycoside phosphotransferase (APT) family kinase protein [Desulforhopalus sp.]|jgi:aminoglycoside phosphotransferase (APT) family kinase protein
MIEDTKEDPFVEYLGKIKTYLSTQDWSHVLQMAEGNFSVSPLARGEYNLNYSLRTKNHHLVFRVNMGSQIDREDQILYEFKTLKLLEKSGVTPRGYFVDNSKTNIDRGISIIEFLDGEHLNYHLDLGGAAATFAKIHSIDVPEHKNHLIPEKQPLTLIYNECSTLLETYFTSPLADSAICDYLRKLLNWADRERRKENYFLLDPSLSIVNTEVNSGNFIVNRQQNTTHLIDWEMPRWGDPSSDLCHFCSPLTTLWKSDYRFSSEDYKMFIESYKAHSQSPHLKQTLTDRMHLKNPFVYLRGISWSAMGWVAYQTEYEGIRNEQTWKKLRSYLDLDFIRTLFDPFLKR